MKGLTEGGESKIFLFYTRGSGASPVFSRARWRNLVLVECLQIMVKPMVVGFFLLEVDSTFGDKCGI